MRSDYRWLQPYAGIFPGDPAMPEIYHGQRYHLKWRWYLE